MPKFRINSVRNSVLNVRGVYISKVLAELLRNWLFFTFLLLVKNQGQSFQSGLRFGVFVFYGLSVYIYYITTKTGKILVNFTYNISSCYIDGLMHMSCTPCNQYYFINFCTGSMMFACTKLFVCSSAPLDQGNKTRFMTFVYKIVPN